ncbi:hypothetical protein CONPUDRAFT_84427 [Coniophora puteana RWD-64-598 SS2]|uniref:Uncharacterized protein n=1 Tax=Coniophora puteana (strain RWD-64-598) TaxID=741705 RepID=A0A5M3MFB3_CONPW|nr:uncharacterized protein CONPUDRAFT_84427 [Coniophora puteana RWD-64-598 SS2]EIW77281.1 hypothetical protein CONPUDRAFT_84427 [Coniophora puteana RWD-64-598 SS2]
MLEYTLERLEGHLGDQLSSAMQLSETTCAIGQETASNVEEIKIIKRVTFKRLGGEELENVEYIADRKSTHAYVDTPQVVLTQPEGGTVRGVDKISRLISTRNSFYSPISTSTFSGLVGAKHLAISNVSIFSKFEPLVDDEPLPKFWTDYPSTHGVILRSPANSLSKSNINKCAQEEKAIENQLERSMCVPDNMASPSLSLENDDTELPEDEGSPSSSTTLSPTSLFTTPTSSPSSSPPTSPSITSVACPEDDEHSSMRTYKSRLPSFLSSCRSLFAVPSSMPTFGRDVEFQTPAFDDVDWFAGMASASWSEGGCWQLP